MSSIKSIPYKLLSASGLPSRLHSLINKGNISILMYHGVVDKPPILPDCCFIESSSFREQLKYLKQHFRLISLSKAVSLLSQDKIKEPTAVITFDDGYQNNFDHAFPIMSELEIPASIFLTTGLIDSNQTIWTGLLHEAFTKTIKNVLTWHEHSFDISSTKMKTKSLQFIKKELKTQDHSLLHEEINLIISDLMGDEELHIYETSPYRILNKESIRSMAKSNLIEFGAHTHSHPILNNLSKKDQELEIINSINSVSDLTGKPCTQFAYPNGGIDDYNDITTSILNDHGIDIALTTIEGTCNTRTPRLELKRFGIGADMNLDTFKLTVHNTLSTIKKFIS